AAEAAPACREGDHGKGGAMSDTIVYAFTAATCPRCQLFLPTLQAWAAKYRDRADFVQVHLDDAPAETIEQLQVGALSPRLECRAAAARARRSGHARKRGRRPAGPDPVIQGSQMEMGR